MTRSPTPSRVKDAGTTLHVDAVVVGAGISGLWLANLLLQRGLSVAVCDRSPVGGSQTMASQGIVHGGLKYALGGRPNRASEALAPMPTRWRACLAGSGEMDLRGVPMLAETMHLFSPEIRAKARTLFASRLFTGATRRLDAARVAPFHRGLLVALDEFVIDVPALVRRLAGAVRERMIPAAVTPAALIPGADGIDRIETGNYAIRADVFLFAAGTGNEALARCAGFADIAMRRRPLRQTIVRLHRPVQVFAHCLTATFGTKPDLTVTSHGQALYVGGKMAEDSIARRPDEQADIVRDLLARTFPALDLSDATFDTCLAVRAEPAQGGLRDAGDAFAVRRGNCVLCWPVKLSLVPRLGDLALALLDDLEPCRNPWPGDPGTRLRYAEPPYFPILTPAPSC